VLVGSVDSSEAKMHIDPGKNGPNWSGPTPLGPVVRCLNSIVSLVVFYFFFQKEAYMVIYYCTCYLLFVTICVDSTFWIWTSLEHCVSPNNKIAAGVEAIYKL